MKDSDAFQQKKREEEGSTRLLLNPPVRPAALREGGSSPDVEGGDGEGMVKLGLW